jgi:AcrR family transcriptional regulator
MVTAQEVPRRKTRSETRQETREKVMAAAAAVFAEKGFAASSVEEITARAGFSRGAFYSNFSDKEDAFFALMDARMERRVAEIAELMDQSTSPLDVFADLEAWSVRAADGEGSSRVQLFAEFRAHALRNDDARRRLAERERALRVQYERAIGGLFDAAGVTPPAPVARLALLVQVLDTFVPLQRALDPDVPEGFLFESLTLMFRAALALGKQENGR